MGQELFMTLPKTNLKLTSRDYAIIKFIFRFKVATTQAIHIKFFNESTLKWAYKRLCALARLGLIQCLTDNRGRHFVWCLNRRGFLALSEVWPHLKEHGYLSEYLPHDILSTAAHLGELLLEIPEHIDLFTEQELRRYDKDYYPDWVPKSYRHRPDGYWKVETPEGPKTIALEVELSEKKKSKYKTCVDFYRDYPEIKQIVWIAGPLTVLKYVHNAITEAIGDRPFIHSFIQLDQFLKDQWQSKIVAGHLKGLSLADILQMPKAHTRGTFTTCALLDTRKAPIRSPTLQIPPFKDFFY
jgi:hypothetical protein